MDFIFSQSFRMTDLDRGSNACGGCDSFGCVVASPEVHYSHSRCQRMYHAWNELFRWPLVYRFPALQYWQVWCSFEWPSSQVLIRRLGFRNNLMTGSSLKAQSVYKTNLKLNWVWCSNEWKSEYEIELKHNSDKLLLLLFHKIYNKIFEFYLSIKLKQINSNQVKAQLPSQFGPS